MKAYLIALCICLVAFVSIPVNAATSEVPQTGQSVCYDVTGGSVACAGTGQDAEHLIGMRWPNPRFTDNGDGTVTDNLTGLMWLEDANCAMTAAFDADGFINWQNALDFIAGIDDGTYSSCQAGHTDWRLPNINELKSLFDYDEALPPISAGHPFSNTCSPFMYWSSTTHPSDRAQAYGNSQYGEIFRVNKGATMCAWPVRDADVAGDIDLGKTGQTLCYDTVGATIACANTGQDGEYQMGAAWPNPRFTDNGDGTIMDNLTGLIWFADVNDCLTTPVNWDVALTTVDDINANPGTYHAIGACDYTGTYDDWRLPNIGELESIAHYDFMEAAAGNSAGWLNGFGFNLASSFYWSSTNDVTVPANAFAMTLATLFGVSSGDKDGSSFYIFPVRGGLYGDPDISVSPTSVDFGSVTVGQSSTQDITVTNNGTYYLGVDAMAALAAPFSVVDDSCADQMVAPGDTCTITLGYDPTSEGSDSGSANVTSDDPGEASVSVSLSGTATPNNPPAAFELVYPSDGTTGMGTTVTMIWKATTDPDGGAINYDITYCEDETFATCTALENVAALRGESRLMKFAKNWITSLITGPLSLMGCGGGSAPSPTDATPSVGDDELSYTATDLNPGTTYHWKVTANDADGGATESEARSFATQ